MSRRASRPSGSRARPRVSAGGGKPLQSLTNLLGARGTEQAEAALDKWVDDIAESADVFGASAAFLANAEQKGFSRDERWLLLSIAAEIADDPVLGNCCEALEARMEHEALEWQGETGGESIDDEPLRRESPLYRALSDAWSSVRMAIEVSFLRDIGMTDMTRAMTEDVNTWERALRDGEATLLGVPRIVLTADDDPFGILLP